MSLIMRSVLADTLKETLNTIVDDDLDGIQSKVSFTKWCDIRSMEDAYEDDLETSGPGLASNKPEGSEMALGTIRQGAMTRYIANTFALKLVISEEMMEDGKYKEAIEAARRLKRAMWKTADIDAALMLVRAENTGYVGGDGLPLASASHLLPGSGTFSNTMAVPMSPSSMAIQVARAAIASMPGHDGLREGYTAESVLCPVEQQSIWEILTKSAMSPEAGNFAAINITKTLDLDVIPVLQWNTTTTNWAIKTDVDNGVQWRWRRKPRNKTWNDNDYETMKYGISARWSRGWSDPRGIYFVGA